MGRWRSDAWTFLKCSNGNSWFVPVYFFRCVDVCNVSRWCAAPVLVTETPPASSKFIKTTTTTTTTNQTNKQKKSWVLDGAFLPKSCFKFSRDFSWCKPFIIIVIEYHGSKITSWELQLPDPKHGRVKLYRNEGLRTHLMTSSCNTFATIVHGVTVKGSQYPVTSGASIQHHPYDERKYLMSLSNSIPVYNIDWLPRWIKANHRQITLIKFTKWLTRWNYIGQAYNSNINLTDSIVSYRHPIQDKFKKTTHSQKPFKRQMANAQI